MDHHHGRAHAHTGDERLECAFVFAVIMRDVRGCTAHVEGNNVIKSGLCGGLDRADDPACVALQDRVLTLEEIRVGQTAVQHGRRDYPAADR